MQVLDCTDQPGIIIQQNSGFRSLNEPADNAILKILVWHPGSDQPSSLKDLIYCTNTDKTMTGLQDLNFCKMNPTATVARDSIDR